MHNCSVLLCLRKHNVCLHAAVVGTQVKVEVEAFDKEEKLKAQFDELSWILGWIFCWIFGRVRGGLGRVYLPRLPIPAMSPKRSASASPKPSTSSRDARSDSSSDGEQLPAQQTTRSGRTSRPPNRHVPSPGKLFSDRTEEMAARRATEPAAAGWKKKTTSARTAPAAQMGAKVGLPGALTPHSHHTHTTNFAAGYQTHALSPSRRHLRCLGSAGTRHA